MAKIDLSDPRYEEVDEPTLVNEAIATIKDPVERNKAIKGALVGAGQGLTLGWGDEIAQKVMEGKKALSESDNPIAKHVLQQIGGYEDPGISARESIKQVEAESPKAFMAGEVAGSFATPTPGLGSAKSIGKTTAILAGQGALQGIGQSEGGTAGEIAKDALIGGVIGGVGGLATAGLGKGLDKIKSAFGKVAPKAEAELVNRTGGTIAEAPDDLLSKGKRFVAQQLGMTEADAKVIQANKGLVKTLESEKMPFNEKIIKTVRTLESDRNKFSNAARSVLSDQPKFTPSQVAKAFEDVAQSAQRLNVDTGEMVPKNLKVMDTLNKVYDDLNRLGTLSEKELKDVAIKQIDSRINYNPVDAADNESNQILKQVRNRIDGLLKTSNPNYAKEMKQLAPREALLERLRKDYGLSSASPEGLVPTDKLTAGIKRVADENKFKDMRTFKKLSELTGLEKQGNDLVTEARLRAVIDRNQYGAPQGSRNVNLGALIGQYAIPAAIGGTAGAVIGGSEGAAVGAVAGAVVDKSGRAIAKNLLMSGVPAKDIIQNAVQPGVSKISQFAGTKFYPILAQAMKAGTYISTDFVLNTDPEYRKIKEESKRNGKTE